MTKEDMDSPKLYGKGGRIGSGDKSCPQRYAMGN